MAARERYMGFMTNAGKHLASRKKPAQTGLGDDPSAVSDARPRNRVATTFEDMDQDLLEAIASDLEMSVAKG